MEQDKVIEYLSLLQRYNWVMGLVPGKLKIYNKKIIFYGKVDRFV